MIQKIIKVGSSLAITIPKSVREALGINAGDTVHTDFDSKNGIFSLVPEKKILPHDEEVLRHALTFIKKYKKDLEKLAE